MESPTPTDLNQTLQDLSTADFPFMRREAARRLGQASMSSEEIVRALAAAEALDRDEGVRAAARQALQAPVHEAFIQSHPDFVREAREEAAHNQALKKVADQQRITAEFLRRRRRQRLVLLLFLIPVAMSCGIILLPVEQILAFYRVVPIAYLVYAGFVLWFSLRDWKCPECNSWLGGWKAQVNPFFSSSPLWCPHCGTRLL